MMRAPPWEAGFGALLGLAILSGGAVLHLQLAPAGRSVDGLLEQPLLWTLVVAVPLLAALGWVSGDWRRGQAEAFEHYQQSTAAGMRALSQREWLTRAIVQTAFDAVLVLDDDEVIVDANPIAARIFGCPLEKLVGRPVAALLPEHRRLGTTLAITRRTAGGEVLGKEWHTHAQHTAGHRFPVDLSMVGLREPGLLLYVLREASTRVDAERERLRAAQDRLRDQTTQQRRQRGAALLGVGVALRDELDRLLVMVDGRDASVGGAASTVAAQLERLQVLSLWDRAEAPASIGPVPIAALVDDLVGALAALTRYRGNEIQVEVDPAIGEPSTDAARLMGAVRALVAEALCLTRGGLVRVEVRSEPGPGAEWVAFYVHVDGPPLPEERLLEMWGWLTAPADDPGPGLGDGLSIRLAHRVARALDGHVNVASAAGEGTTFTLRVPVEAERRRFAASERPLRLDTMA